MINQAAAMLLAIACFFMGVIAVFCILILPSLRTRRLASERLQKIIAQYQQEGSLTPTKQGKSNYRPGIIKQAIVYPRKIEFFLYRSGFFTHRPQYVIKFFLVFLTTFILIKEKAQMGIWRSFLLSGLLASATITYLLFMEAKRWQDQFMKDFPFALDMIARALHSGLSIYHGISLIAKEIEGPIGVEFQNLDLQMNIGLNMVQALEEAAARINLTDFRFFCIVLMIQQEGGGNLSEILITLGQLIREQHAFNQKIKALTAESRASANILTILPIVVVIFMVIFQREYFIFFLENHTGRILLGISIALVSLGTIITRWLVGKNKIDDFI